MKKYVLSLFAILFAIVSMSFTLNEKEMGFKFEKSEKIINILDGNKTDIITNIKLLSEVYFEKTGKKLNKGCPSCINEMILTLKNIYKMTQFKFKRHAASYKNKKGDKTTISNSTMTDEKAIEFLKTNSERIRLFSVFPSNWEQLIIDGVNSETDAEKEVRLAAEAEAKAVDEANENTDNESSETEAESLSREDLIKIPLAELRKKYPKIKATSIKNFVDKIIAW